MCNERNVLDFDPADEKNSDVYFESIEDELTVREKQNIDTISASAEKTVRDCSKTGRNAVRALRGALDAAIGHLGVAISYDTATNIISGHTEIMSEVKSDVSIDMQTVDPGRDTLVQIMIPAETLEIMQGRIDKSTTRLELQAITTTDNVFIDDTSACPKTSIVHLKVQDSDAHVPVVLQKLPTPIEISLPVHKPLTDAEIDEGKILPPAAVSILPWEEIDDYYEIPAYQLYLPYNAKVIMKILGKTSGSMTIQILPFKDRRATFSDFCSEMNSVIELDPVTDTAEFYTDMIGYKIQII